MDKFRSDPFYSFSANGEPMILDKVPTQLKIESITKEGTGNVIFYQKKPNIEIHTIFEGFSESEVLRIQLSRFNLTFAANKQNIPGWVKHIEYLEPDKLSIIWQPAECYIGSSQISQSKNISSLFFHLLNFVADQNLLLVWKKWQINLNKNILSQKQEDKGGHQFIGCITLSNDKNFSTQQASEVLEGLSYFFSFCMSRWCTPFLYKGFDSKDLEIWKVWSTPKVEYKYVDSWLHEDFSHEQVLQLFPLFMDAWENEILRNTLKTTIYWYITANCIPEIEAKIILMQAAFERLSYDYVVLFKKLMTPKGFKQLSPASEKFRLLFALLHNQLIIPLELKELSKLQKYTDSPHVLTDIRNSLVHPKINSQFTVAHLVECADMMIWLYEITLLNALGYKKKYQSRLQDFTNYIDLP